MPDKEFNLEDWWEEEVAGASVPWTAPMDAFGAGALAVPSLSKTTAWGDVGTIGLNRAISKDEMENALAETFKKLPTTKMADEWFYVIRRCDDLDVHEYVIASEDLIYKSKTSTKIGNSYAALPLSELYFHILRTYARAREGDFVSAHTLWVDIHENWLHHANDYRKPFILSSLYLAELCVNEWKQCMRYLKQLWSLTKFMDGIKRHAFGIWDEWTTCLLVSWFFMKYSSDFRKVFCADYIAQAHPFIFQRKSIILKNLSNSFIADVIPEAYYNKARELNPELPEIEYKEEKRIAHLRLPVP